MSILHFETFCSFLKLAKTFVITLKTSREKVNCFFDSEDRKFDNVPDVRKPKTYQKSLLIVFKGEERAYENLKTCKQFDREKDFSP